MTNLSRRMSITVLVLTVTLFSMGTFKTDVAVAKKSNGSIAKQIAIYGDTACALTSAGTVKCWGGDLFGTWGDNENFDTGIPVLVSGLEPDVVSISTSLPCALMSNSSVKCWGSARTFGRDQVTQSNGMQAVDIGLQLTDVFDVSGGGYTNEICYRTQSTFRRCLRLDPNSKTFDESSVIPMPDAPVRKFVNVSSEYLRFSDSVNNYQGGGTCFISSEGDLHCYQKVSSMPADGEWKPVLKGVKDAEGPCLVSVNNSLSCYDYKQRAIVEVLPDDVAFISGNCVSLISGGVKCWRQNYWQNGFNPVLSLSDEVKEIVGSCAVTTNGTLKCWGNLDVDLPGIVNARQLIVSNGGGGCAITDIGGIKCWGDNSRGQLGNGTDEITYEVVDVLGFNHEESVVSTSTTVKKSLGNSTTSSTPSDDMAIDDDWRPGKTPNGVRVEVNGRAISVRMRVVGEELLLDSSVIDVSIGGGDLNSEDYSVETDSPIRLNAEDEFDLVIGNLEPDSEIKARVFSDPVTLGNSIADRSGAATMRVKIPKALLAGSHSLVLNATSAKSEPIVLIVGIVLNKNASGLNLTFFAVVVIVLGILGALLLPAMRTRKMEN